MKYIKLDERDMIVAVYDDEVDASIPAGAIPLSDDQAQILANNFTAIQRYRYDAQSQTVTRMNYVCELADNGEIVGVFDQANNNAPAGHVLTDSEFNQLRGQHENYIIRDGQLVLNSAKVVQAQQAAMKDQYSDRANGALNRVVNKNRLAERLLDMFLILDDLIAGNPLSPAEQNRYDRYKAIARESRQQRQALNQIHMEIDTLGDPVTALPDINPLD